MKEKASIYCQTKNKGTERIFEWTKGDSSLFPFFWLHGNSHNIERELNAMRAAGFQNFCVESRGHKDFGGESWFADLDTVLGFAEHNGMKMWLLDDCKFPTGYANGLFKTKYPELKKLCLFESHIDAIGGGERLFDVESLFRMPMLGIDGTLKAILLATRTGKNEVFSHIDDVTAQYTEGLLRLDLPKGKYRIIVVFAQRKGGREDYLNLLDDKSTDVLIEATYEPHFQRYSKYFGKTFVGFFSDEPELGNFRKDGLFSYHLEDKIGDPIPLPWSEELEKNLELLWDESFGQNLAALWAMAEDGGHQKLRLVYMDEMTKLVQKNFSERLGGWCAAHGVDYVGHFIEDQNAHARLSSGAGHYFRASSGMTYAGIDIVLSQLLPGEDDDTGTQFAFTRSDREFYAYALAPLAASAARLDRKKHGRAMCEIFGAYGWSEGLKLMKYLADHMLVSGINTFVPHAFDDEAFPNFDCPPHFFAGGNNPQFRLFPFLTEYMSRLCNLFSGGSARADVAVLYHAEAEWLGGESLIQKPLRTLCRRRVGADVIPFDAIAGLKIGGKVNVSAYDTCFKDDKLQINDRVYSGLLVPKELLEVSSFREVFELIKKEGIFVGSFEQVNEIPAISPIESQSETLRVLEYEREGSRIFMIQNDGEEPSQAQVHGENYMEYDAFSNILIPCLKVFDLAPYESKVLIEGENDEKTDYKTFETAELKTVYEVSAATLQSYPNFFPIEKVETLKDMNKGERDRFAGTYRYRFDLEIPYHTDRIRLDLCEVFESAEVRVNGNLIGTRIATPYVFDIGINGIYEGVSKLEVTVDVTTTLGRAVRDFFSSCRAYEPCGLIGPVQIQFQRFQVNKE